ncbi:hypothetical protein NIBR502772_05930 [Pseudarthrobacter sp. NIBRBAC000502772]|uniref:hypothetical protein n=1 Tax=Pseudarthrobacter sp. NIBRBAC000502772 TaxID=2590775 RepID=UPI001131C73F|nr:hypothetical protein [Pseudarthrobacter sp. NIBRBAC000502772]QDG65813.1 hypothetical protein NIBR502772_05930 [Pseudarthrobacter sp. NIBRBAC000502772]
MKAAALEDTTWSEDAVATIIGISHTQEIFTADDLARELRKAPFPNAVGIAFSQARRAGYIEPVSYTTSSQTARKHGVVRTWRRKVNEGFSL